MRAYLTGTTQTSIWKNYEKGCRSYCGHQLPDKMKKNQKLPEILLTPTTKAKKDIPISEDEIITQNIMTKTQFDICKDYAFKLFNFGQQMAEERGLILVDTKYEFGIDQYGNILVVDEMHTPDSSRYWSKESYEKTPENPLCYDKEILRKWIKDNYEDPYDTNVDIHVPEDIIKDMYLKYLQLCSKFSR